MNRRQLVRGSALLPAVLLAARSGFAAAGPPEGAFSPSSVRDLARALASKPYEAPDEKTVREHAERGGFPADNVFPLKRDISPQTAKA